VPPLEIKYLWATQASSFENPLEYPPYKGKFILVHSSLR
jgi:hypothetical protein